MMRARNTLQITTLWLGAALACHSQMQLTATSITPALTFAQSVLVKAGITSTYKPLIQCQAAGTEMIYGSSKSRPGEVALTISTDGTTKLVTSFDGFTRTVTYLGVSGSTTTEHHAPIRVPVRTALLSQRLYLPAIELADIVNDPSSTISMAGPMMVNGHSVYTLTVLGHWSDMSLDPTSIAPSVTYRVDASSLIIVGREDVIEDPRDKRTHYTRSFVYESYQVSGGISLPYTVTELFQGQTIATTYWNSMTVSF